MMDNWEIINEAIKQLNETKREPTVMWYNNGKEWLRIEFSITADISFPEIEVKTGYHEPSNSLR